MRHPVGDLRQSQAVHTFGVGSTVDLPHFTAVVLGLEDWSQSTWDPLKPNNALSEERLLRVLRSFVGDQLVQLTNPPVVEEDRLGAGNVCGIPVTTFPRWARCPRCEILAPLDFGVFKLETNPWRPSDVKYVHSTCPKAHGKAPKVNPVRFVFTCKNGHIDDFPWARYIQSAPGGCGGARCTSGPYKLQERGVSSEVADLWLRCDTCNAARPMTQAFGDEASGILGSCSGHHPHLGRGHSDGECDVGEPRTMLLGSSNQWFPMSVSSLSIPKSTSALQNLLDAHWNHLGQVEDQGELRTLRKHGLLQPFSEVTDDELMAAIEAKRGDDNDGPTNTSELKAEEWELLSQPVTAPQTDDFKIRSEGIPQGFEDVIAEVVAVDRLRSVKALTGFTRIDSPGDYSDLSQIPDVQQVQLSRTPPKWLPAFEVRGEGIFVRFDEDAISQWRTKPGIVRRERELKRTHVGFRQSRNIQPSDDGFDVLRFALVHTFSHIMMRQLAIECGYAAASIQERIYSRPGDDQHPPMCGVMFMTAAADSEGTLGGLVRLAQPKLFGRHVRQALHRASLCSSDPLCSEHIPDSAGRDLHGAACHACAFVAETSCERGNKYLDRSLVVDTVGGHGAAFFQNSGVHA